ncbi:hypothetical protein O4H49_01730 [Kiloniella laminariae]|uniref:Uncharacterized protein n=1 Tax=Kiloniella laminariae TaxID=454162 RepID=A0ABT4LHI8_9PROT|nr:hypothetical protein [Kiloniella laminariae]MCZ4279477.1 hypothetical protein [Kiloniella laminariae]
MALQGDQINRPGTGETAANGREMDRSGSDKYGSGKSGFGGLGKKSVG